MCAITFLPGSIQKLGSTSSMNVAMSPSGSLTLDLALGTFVALVFWWYSNWKKRSLSLIPLLTTVNYYASFISASLLFLSFTLSDILFLRCQTLFFFDIIFHYIYHFGEYTCISILTERFSLFFSFLFSILLYFSRTSLSALLRCYTLLYSTLLYSALLFSTSLCSTLLYSTLLYSTPLFIALLCSTLLLFALLYCQAVDTPEVVS